MHNSLSAGTEIGIPVEYISRDYNNTKKSHYPSSHNEESYPENHQTHIDALVMT